MILASAPTVIPPEDEALRPRIRAFLAEALGEMPADRRARSWMGYDADFSRRLAERGFVGLTLPVEYDGGGRGAFARYVVVEELLAAGAPVAAHWIADRQSAPLILRYGTAAQKQKLVPGICRGEIYFCIGMSEPNSGSDLASIRTRAVRTADGWRLTGSKIWTTIAQHAHYMIALARSSGQPEDRQKGLSQFLIDLSLPGVRIRPIRDAAGDEHFNEVFFDDVLLPADALIGEEGAGWAQVNAELAFERSGPERFLSSVVVLDAWIAWLRTDPGLGESGAVLLGRLIASLAALRGMSLAVTALLAAEEEDPVQGAALVKDLGTEYEQYLPVAIADAIAAVPDRSPPPELLRALQYTSVMAPSFSLRGGTREIIRGMIARGMGLR